MALAVLLASACTSRYVVKRLDFEAAQVAGAQEVVGEATDRRPVKLKMRHVRSVRRWDGDHLLVKTPTDGHAQRVLATLLYSVGGATVIAGSALSGDIDRGRSPGDAVAIALLTTGFAKLVAATVLVVVGFQSPQPAELLDIRPPRGFE